MNWLRSLVKKIKQILKKQPFMAAIALSVAFYSLSKVFNQKVPAVKLNYFILALKQDMVTDVRNYSHRTGFWEKNRRRGGKRVELS